MNICEILVPCRRFEIVATLATEDGLSILEQQILLAVRAGATSIDLLAAHLAIPRRMVLDVSLDLLSLGAIVVAPESGELQLSDATCQRMGQGEPTTEWSKGLESRGGEDIELRLVQDLVSGAIFPPPPFRPNSRGRLPVAPRAADLVPLSAIPLTDLFLAAARRVRAGGVQRDLHDYDEGREASRLRGGRIAAVRAGKLLRGSNPTSESTEVLIPMHLLARRANGSIPPHFDIVGPSEISTAVRQQIAVGIQNAWDADLGKGTGQFFSQIDWSQPDEPAVVEQVPSDLDGLLARFRLLEAVVESVDLSREPALVEACNAARAALDEARSSQAACDLVWGAAAHHEIVLEALASATHQVVLVCPWIRQLDVNESLRYGIDAALARGVNVFVLWGITAQQKLTEELPPQILAWIAELQRRTTAGRFVIPNRACSLHAKVVICDMEWLVVTSHNFLSSGPERKTGEVGVRVRSAGTALPRAFTDTFAWLRSAISEYEVRRALFDAPEFFGKRLQDASLVVSAPPSAPNLEHGAVAIKMWKRDWVAMMESVNQHQGEIAETAQIVSDAYHRHLLLGALDTAQERILVQSPDLGGALLADTVLNQVKAACTRGVRVVVVSAAAATGSEKLRELGALVGTSDSHAKLLVCDSWAVVSSFNFLSFEGRHRRELGIRLTRSRLVEELWFSAVEQAGFSDATRAG